MTFLEILCLFLAMSLGVVLGVIAAKLGTLIMKRSHILYGPVFIPSHNADIETMIASAKIKPNEKVADLGSGDGKVVIALAQHGIEAHGYENSPSLVWQSRRRIRQLGLTKKAVIHWRDFWRADLRQYDIIMMYTSQFTMEKLEKKIHDQLKPGARVVSNTFQFPNWKPSKKKGKIFVYEK